MQAFMIKSGIWRIEDGFVRCFLVEGERKSLLIDSGATTDEARKIAESLTTLPIELINTHADKDHIAGNGCFPFALMHPAEAANYYNIGGGTGKILPIGDGEMIDLGDRKLEVILIPGHTPGSIALLDEDEGVLFSGDTVQDGNIYMFGPMRDMHAYIFSLRRLLEYSGRFKIIHPSHGSLSLDRDFIDVLLYKAELCIEGKLRKEPFTIQGGQVVERHDASIAGFLM